MPQPWQTLQAYRLLDLLPEPLHTWYFTLRDGDGFLHAAQGMSPTQPQETQLQWASQNRTTGSSL